MRTTGLTDALIEELEQHLTAMGGRRGMIAQDRQRGLTPEQIAASQGTNIANVQAHLRSIDRMLGGELPDSSSTALKEARAYNFLLDRDLSPDLHRYVIRCLHQLQECNSSVQIKPQQPGATRDVRTRRSMTPAKTCPECGLAHAGECP